MNIVVLLKQTFDTEEKIIIQDGKIKEDGVQFIPNPYDEYAVEEAITLRDQVGGTVTVLSMGPVRVEEALRKALAMGVDEAVILSDEALFGDEFSASVALAAAVKKIGFDVVLAGNQAVDDGSGQVAIRVAELLNIPHVATITKLEVSGTDVVAHRDAEGDLEVVETKLPALFTAQQGLNEPRYPSLIGIRKANKKEITHWNVSDLDLAGSDLAAKVTIAETFAPPVKAAGRVLTGELGTQVQELVGLLRGTDKVV